MNARALLLLCTLALAASGCNTIQGFPEPRPTIDVKFPNPGYQLGPDGILKYNEATDPLKKKTLRNEIIDTQMAAIDIGFADFERAIYKEGIGWGVGTDWAVLALTAATAIVDPVDTKTALAAVSTAVIGAKASFDKTALFDKTLPALLAQMVAQRETLRAQIRESEDLPVDKYTLSAAMSDLHKFEFAGSLPGAIVSITQDAGYKAAIASQKLLDVREGKFVKSASGDALRNFWKPDGTTVNDANRVKLEAWMNQNGISTAPGMITMFLHGDQFEASRVQAAKDLGLIEQQ
jgi:hypothetical protein